MRGLVPALSCIFLVFGPGCFHRRALCTAEGGEAWREIESAHFRILTNRDSRSAIETAIQFEQYRKALFLSWSEELDPAGRLEVVVLDNLDQLREFVAPPVAGFVSVGPSGWRAVIAGDYTQTQTPLPQVQLHELAHYFSRFALLRQPTWISEGLATYLETIEVKADPARAVMGRPHPEWLRYVLRNPRLSLNELWKWKRKDASEAQIHRFYASAWLWVHFLLNQHGAPFSDFQQRLAHAEEPRKAWDAAFNGVSTDQLERGLSNYLFAGQYALITFPLPAVPTETKEKLLKDAEVHVIRAMLHLFAPGQNTADERLRLARMEIAQALREDPRNVHALVLQVGIKQDKKEQLAIARELVKSNPDEPAVLALLARVLGSDEDASPEIESMLERASQLAPNDFSVLNQLAWYYATHGMPEKGLKPAVKAVRLAPWSAEILDTYAAVLAGIGRCSEAVVAQKRALDLIDERRAEQLQAKLQGKLSEYEQRCAEKTSDR